MRNVLFVSLIALLLSACNNSAPVSQSVADDFATTAINDINLFVKAIENPAGAMRDAIERIPSSLDSSSTTTLATQSISFCPDIAFGENSATVDFDDDSCQGNVGDVSVDFSGKVNFSGEAFRTFNVNTSPDLSLELSDGSDYIRGSFGGGMNLTTGDDSMSASIDARYKLEGSQIVTLATDYDLELNIDQASLLDSSYDFSGSITYTKDSSRYTARVSTPQALEIRSLDFCAGPVAGKVRFDFGSDVVEVEYISCNRYAVTLNGEDIVAN